MGKTRDVFKKIRDTKETFHASSVQSLSHVRLFVSPWTAACQASLSITNSWSSFKLMSVSIVPLSFPHNLYSRLAIAFTMHKIAASVTPSVPA